MTKAGYAAFCEHIALSTNRKLGTFELKELDYWKEEK
jgi:hypothetical protein